MVTGESPSSGILLRWWLSPPSSIVTLVSRVSLTVKVKYAFKFSLLSVFACFSSCNSEFVSRRKANDSHSQDFSISFKCALNFFLSCELWKNHLIKKKRWGFLIGLCQIFALYHCTRQLQFAKYLADKWLTRNIYSNKIINTQKEIIAFRQWQA